MPTCTYTYLSEEQGTGPFLYVVSYYHKVNKGELRILKCNSLTACCHQEAKQQCGDDSSRLPPFGGPVVMNYILVINYTVVNSWQSHVCDKNVDLICVEVHQSCSSLTVHNTSLIYMHYNTHSCQT